MVDLYQMYQKPVRFSFRNTNDYRIGDLERWLMENIQGSRWNTWGIEFHGTGYGSAYFYHHSDMIQFVMAWADTLDIDLRIYNDNK